MEIYSRILKGLLVIVALSLSFNQVCSICQQDEFACDNGVCIPKTQYCNTYSECGDESDETGCNNTQDCLDVINHIRRSNCGLGIEPFASTENATDRVSFVYSTADVGLITSMELEAITGPGVLRFNIRTPYDQRTAYVDSRFESFPPLGRKRENNYALSLDQDIWDITAFCSAYQQTYVDLMDPMIVHMGDEVIITSERSEDPKSLPWVSELVPPCTIFGFQENRSCSLQSSCEEWFVDSTQFEIDSCRTHLDTILEWLKRCLSFCLEDTFADPRWGHLTFPRTNTNQVAYSIEKCPSSDVPLASRTCVRGFTMWEDPVSTDCPNDKDERVTLRSLAEFYRNKELNNSDVLSVSDKVVAETGITQNDSDVLKFTIFLLEKIVEVGSHSSKVTSNVLHIVDNVLSNKMDNFLPNIADMEPSRILSAVQNQLSHFHSEGEQANMTFMGFSIFAQAVRLGQSDTKSSVTFRSLFSSSAKDTTEGFASGETSLEIGNTSVNEADIRCMVTLPAALFRETTIGPNGTIPVTLVVYRPDLLFNNELTINVSQKTVGSVVLLARVEGHTIRDLEDPVILRFHTNYNGNETRVKDTKECVYWKFTSGGNEGRWSSTGCQMQKRSRDDDDGSITECHCDHLTNFAVLIDVSGDIHSAALDFLSMIGCVVSIIALIITIITFLMEKKLRTRRAQQILINLCFALLGLYLFFLFGINRVQTEIGCVIFGALIHFFCLSSLAWMAVEATNMYLLFVRVFDSGVSGFMWKAMVAGWGFPFVIVVLCAIITPENYTSTYCFPRAGTATFNFGVLLLVAFLLLYNIVMFVIVFYKLFLVRAQIKSTSKSRTDLIRQTQNAVSISVLLGLTWIFGFFSLGGAHFIFNLLFILFSSLQGLFVFLLFCLRHQESRDAWKNCFSCKKEEPSEASRSYPLTATTSK